MKILIAFILFASVAQADQINDVRVCLQEQWQAQVPFKDRVVLASRCLSQADSLKYSSDISAKSLYILALFQVVTFSENSTGQKNATMTNEFETKLGTSVESVMTDQALADVFHAARWAYAFSAYLYDSKVGVEYQQRLFNQLQRRGLATNQQASDLIGVLELNSEWAKARKLSLRYPEDGEVMPVTNQVAGPAFLVDRGDHFQAKAFRFKGPQIIMSGSCHFAISAIEEFAKHPDIAQLWKKHGFALADSETRLLPKMRELKAKYPSFEMYPAMNLAAWTDLGFDMIASPRFAFLKDGRILFTLPGFYYDGTMISHFCEGLNKIGLSTASCAR